MLTIPYRKSGSLILDYQDVNYTSLNLQQKTWTVYLVEVIVATPQIQPSPIF